MARRNEVTGILDDWSIRITSTSFFVTLISIQDPRSGMMRQEWSRRSPASSSIEKSTPGDRCNWLTMTRSAPLMMNSPPPIMIGNSPTYTSSSIGSGYACPLRRTVMRNGRPYVSRSARHWSGVYRGRPRRYET